MVDYTKIDWTKYDMNKMFDVEKVFDQLEKTNQTFCSLITDQKTKNVVEHVSNATMDFAKAHATAVKSYSTALQRAFSI